MYFCTNNHYLKHMHNIFSDIKNRVKASDASARIILFGSFARNENRKDSDIDLLILSEKTTLSIEEENKIKNPLYDLEFESGQMISPIILSKHEWESTHNTTPFFENILKEGIAL